MFASLSSHFDDPRGRVSRGNAFVDNSVYASRYADMPPSEKRVALVPFADPERAVAMVAERSHHLARTEPELSRNITAADPDDLRAWHGARTLHGIEAGGDIVGLIAAAPGTIERIEGDEVNGEIVAVEHAGHGYA